MKKVRVLLLSLAVMLFAACAAFAEPIAALKVEGNREIVSDYILRNVKSTVGSQLNRQTIMDDIKAIYDLGFFSYVDAKVELTPSNEAILTYLVTENPVIKEIKFEGNTVYPDDKLRKLLFTKTGTIFNRVFFRNDVQRLYEQYQKDGYVMTRIQDVQIDDGIVTVKFIEPRIHDILIQGNNRTKTYVIRRNIPLNNGDLFNSTLLRHSLAKLRNLGFFDDVNVGYEPVEGTTDLDVIVTVREKKSASLVFSVSYGSSSGLGGGISYRESNLGGRARVLEAGFDRSSDNRNYWLSLADPYMDRKTFAWKMGAYKREDDELNYNLNRGGGNRLGVFEYDEKRDGIYAGFGRKFGHNEQYSWYLTADWHKSKTKWTGVGTDVKDELASKQYFNHVVESDALNSKVFSTTLELTRNNMDKFLSYPKGDRETIGVEQAWKTLGGDWDYTKYWAEAVAFCPLKGLEDYIRLGQNEDRPAIFAARVRAGFSDGKIPLSEMYSLGGANSIRGYESSYFKGNEMFLANFELRVPVDDNFSVVAFYDMGNAWDTQNSDQNTDGFDLSDLEKTPGVGVRVKTPLGNVRVDVARGKDNKGDDETQFHFGFGEMF